MNDDRRGGDPDSAAATTEPGVWRDEEELPLYELAQSMATYSSDEPSGVGRSGLS